MSESDQAFIKVYTLHQAEPMPPAPHTPLAGTPVSMDDVPAEVNHVWDDAHLENTRPLSAFHQPESDSQPERDFQPALEVDEFLWPDVCDRLVEQSDREMDTALRPICQGCPVSHGHVLAIAGCHRNEGRTTALMCIARWLAARQIPAALVDADFHRPGLAEHLGLAVTAGWDDVLKGDVPLSEAVIESNADRLTLLPLRSSVDPAQLPSAAVQASVSLRVLGQHYPIVLVDLGPVLDNRARSTMHRLSIQGAIQDSLLIRDLRRADVTDIHLATDALMQLGFPVRGIIETFSMHLPQPTRPRPSPAVAHV